MTTAPACLGGWCLRRDTCANYLHGVGQPVERLCQKGRDGVSGLFFVQPLSDDDMTAKNSGAWRVDAALRSIDDKGTTLAVLHEACGYSNTASTLEIVNGLMRAGQVFAVKAKLTTDVHLTYYFRTQHAADAFLEDYRQVAAERAAELRAARHKRKAAVRKAKRQERLPQIEAEMAKRKSARDAERAARVAAKNEAAAEARRAKEAERKRIKAAKSVVARMPGRKQIDTAQMLYRIRAQEVRAIEDKRAGRDDRPVIVPEHVKPQVIKTKPGRFEVVDEITGGFGALKPGQYAFEPSSCAARAAA